MAVHFWAVFIAAFLASSVEFVEAFTIVLVIGVTVNWRSSFLGMGAAILVLAAIVAVFGAGLIRVIPIESLRLVVGVLLLLFGLKWLKKALLRFAGLKALHDEEAIYEAQLEELKARGIAGSTRVDPFGVVTSFKSVLLEGLEVAFIVLTFGLQANSPGHQNGIAIAALGAAAALGLVIVVGAVVRAPLQRVPENTLKFVVGLMLATFGTFWGGEGLGIQWWGGDLCLVPILGFYLVLSAAIVVWLRGAPRLRQDIESANEKVPPRAVS
jgi:uncharacterized membrane protein